MIAPTDSGDGLRELLGTLPAYAVAERLDLVRVVLLVDAVQGRHLLATATVRIADGNVLVLGPDSAPEPDVTFRTGPEVLAGIVHGELNPSTLHW